VAGLSEAFVEAPPSPWRGVGHQRPRPPRAGPFRGAPSYLARRVLQKRGLTAPMARWHECVSAWLPLPPGGYSGHFRGGAAEGMPRGGGNAPQPAFSRPDVGWIRRRPRGVQKAFGSRLEKALAGKGALKGGHHEPGDWQFQRISGHVQGPFLADGVERGNSGSVMGGTILLGPVSAARLVKVGLPWSGQDYTPSRPTVFDNSYQTG